MTTYVEVAPGQSSFQLQAYFSEYQTIYLIILHALNGNPACSPNSGILSSVSKLYREDIVWITDKLSSVLSKYFQSVTVTPLSQDDEASRTAQFSIKVNGMDIVAGVTIGDDPSLNSVDLFHS